MKAHPTDGPSLTFGVIFLVIVGWWTLARTIDVTPPNLGWFVAGGLILLGVLGLVGALRRPKQEPVSPPTGDGGLTGSGGLTGDVGLTGGGLTRSDHDDTAPPRFSVDPDRS